jgi:hypothetical protein
MSYEKDLREAERIGDLVKRNCTCGRSEGERYTTFVEDHATWCLFRIYLPTLREATRDEGFTRG